MDMKKVEMVPAKGQNSINVRMRTTQRSCKYAEDVTVLD